jgi:5-methyltetrahydrofolate--homocysteine methyltransferase
VDLPLCLDSPDPKVLEMAFGLVNKPPMINSISLETERYRSILAFLEGKDCSILALCLDDSGMPKSADEVVERAGTLVEGLTGIGFPSDRIYIDPLVQPLGTNSDNGRMVLEAVEKIKRQFESVRTNCGLSNVSFGLPTRKRINRTFLVLMMAAGLDAAILDPLDAEIMATVKTAEMVLGNDRFCRNFLRAYRAGQIPA